MSRLILASASPRRRLLLAEHGFAAEVCPAEVVESEDPRLAARDLVLHNARLKCAAVAADFPGDVTLGVDTLVSLDGAVFGKPGSLAQAHAMLARLSGREHAVFSGVCLRKGREVTFVEETRVTFRALTAEAIAAYHAAVDPLDKAGAYGAQERSEMIIARTEGSWSNILGLPMERLTAALADFGVFPTAPGV